MEETETGTHNTKVSDSGYSNSCSNSQSQRSGSSKSRHSGSSSGSSGYCGHPSTLGSSNDSFQRPSTMKRKEYKKKKLKAMNGELLSESANIGSSIPNVPLEVITVGANTSPHPNIENTFLTSGNSQSNEKENVQLNTLPHNTLANNCIKKHKGKEITSGKELCEGPTPANRLDNEDDKKADLDNIHRITSHKEEFSAVVSMEEGVVLYTTSSLTDVLGYPKDMWLGRSLIDFVHPKDRKAFNNHITTVISTPFISKCEQNGQSSASNKKNSFFCCLRQYRGLKSTGFGVIDKKVSYIPCQLVLSFREISTKSASLDVDVNDKKTQTDENIMRAILLVITARPVRSVYTIPDEMCVLSTYTTTRHSTSLVFTHVDPEVVTYFGFLPQDMIGQSVFDFYHPEDLPYLKEVYENVFKDKGQLFHSKPYRFRTQNGGFSLIETEWSSFVNPWTRKIEFISGQHSVIKGPPNPDVTTPSSDPESLQVSEDVLKECKVIKEEIINFLNETAEASDTSKHQLTKYCKKFLTFMENFVDEEKANSDKSPSKPVSLSISERDSVMLGEISPHHEYYGSKSSSETPPSYNQLNYNDNIERFFESKPKTTLSDESGDSKTSLCDRERNTQLSGADDEDKISPPVDSSSGGSQNRNNESGNSSDLSYGCASRVVNSNIKNNTSNNENSSNKNNKYRTPHLTEELLSRHNENMEKKMVQRHRERSKSDREHKMKDGRHKKTYDKILDDQNTHGVKRSGSHSWEGEPFKSIKQTHEHGDNEIVTNGINSNNNNNNTNSNNATNATCNGTTSKQFSLQQTTQASQPKSTMETSNSINLWPPFSVSVTPMPNTQPCATHMSYSAASLGTSTMMPVYYMSPEVPSHRTDHCSTEHGQPLSASPYIQQNPYVTSQFPYVSSMMYHPVATAATAMPMFGIPPTVMYSPLTVLPTPLLAPQPPMKPKQHVPLAQQLQPSTSVCTDNDSKTVGNSTSSQLRRTSVNRKTQRPASQATSVKAQPGSALCSIASNSMQQALSETSKREEKSQCNSMSQSMASNESSGSAQEDAKADIEIDLNSNDMLETPFHNDSSSYYSSFYSFMKTDEKSDESMKSLTENDSSVETNTENKEVKCCTWKRRPNNSKSSHGPTQRQIRKVPPWLENVTLTPELLMKYQVSEKELSDVLAADLKLLTEIDQPLAVNDQLCQLYLDIENFHQDALETSIGITSSSGASSGEGDDYQLSAKMKEKYRTMEYSDRMVMLYEENAPMPSPLSTGTLPLLPVHTN